MKDPLITQTSQDRQGNVRYPVIDPTLTPTALATTAAVTAAQIAGQNLTNTGAGGGTVYTLPKANTMPNQGFRFYVTVAQTSAFSPVATEYVALAGSKVVNKDLQISAVVGQFVDVYSNGENWVCWNHSGIVIKEA